MTEYLFENALLPEGWARNVKVSVDDEGIIRAVEPCCDGGGRDGSASKFKGFCVPGMPNLHSHAFQRAMAGLAEIAGPAGDSFWTWRNVMYGFLGRIGPEDLQAIAAQLYVEMLKRGYTAVGEFHYLHHDPVGAPYSRLSEMADRIVAASRASGIALTLLPVAYAHSGFGGAEPTEGQRRFINDADRYAQLLDELFSAYGGDRNIRIGIAPHSLRAVTPEMLGTVIAALDGHDATAPIHIHIAEQVKEVQDCLHWSGKRPIEWLLSNVGVDRRWCLVHATHMTDEETDGLAAAGAVAGLCPTTEANLGDGLFPAIRYLEKGGVFGIGSDSHISVDPAEELRLLEYGQRLVTRSRNVLAGGEGKSTGVRLYLDALKGGAQACGLRSGALAAGMRADMVVLDGKSAALSGRNGNSVLDSWIFFGNDNPVKDVIVGGRVVVEGGRHFDQEKIANQYHAAMKRIMDA